MERSDVVHIYKELQNRLGGFILARVADKDAAADILQNVFLRVHDSIESLRDESKIESWIFQIARNAIIDYYRSRKPAEEVLDSHAVEEEREEEPATERLTPALHEFIEQLPDPYREALLLTELQGISQKELAERMGLSPSGAKSRVQRGRAMLKDLLMRCCHFEFDLYGTLIDYHEHSCCCCKERSKSAVQKRC